MIRWKRLQVEAAKLSDKKIVIHSTTELCDDIRAFVKDDGGTVTIVLNMMLNKSETDVVDSLAHELAHVTLSSKEHTPEHADEMKRIQKVLNESLERSRKNAKVS